VDRLVESAWCSAVALLERTIGKMDREALLGFNAGRRDVIWALEGTALYGDLFIPSAKLLLALAEAENETWSNNATGVFAGLFSLGYGAVAPTSLAPERGAVISLFDSESALPGGYQQRKRSGSRHTSCIGIR
jgi:hypothetical protein